MKISKLVILIGLIVLATLATPAPALAQDGNPPVVTTEESGGTLDWVFPFLEVSFKVIVALSVFAVVGEKGTEVAKEFLRQASQVKLPLMKYLAVQKGWSAILALAIAGAMVWYPKFDLSFFQQFELFKDLDPLLIKILNTALLWLAQNYVHRDGSLNFLFKATPVAQLTFYTPKPRAQEEAQEEAQG